MSTSSSCRKCGRPTDYTPAICDDCIDASERARHEKLIPVEWDGKTRIYSTAYGCAFDDVEEAREYAHGMCDMADLLLVPGEPLRPAAFSVNEFISRIVEDITVDDDVPRLDAAEAKVIDDAVNAVVREAYSRWTVPSRTHRIIVTEIAETATDQEQETR